MLLKKPSGVSGNTSPAPTSVVSSESSAPANVLPTVRPEANELNNAFTNLRHNLKIFAFIRGGRLPSSLKSRLPNSPQSPGRTPLFVSKLLHLVKLFPRLFLFAVPDVQYAKASSLRSCDLSTLRDSDIATLMENFRNTCFEELKLIVAVASFLSASILGQMLYRPHILSITSFLAIAAASSMVTSVQSLTLWHSFSYLASDSAGRRWVHNLQKSSPPAMDPWTILSLPMVGLHWGLVAFIVANVILIWTDPDGVIPPPTPSNLSHTTTRIAIGFIITLGGILAVLTRSIWRGYMTASLNGTRSLDDTQPPLPLTAL